MRVLCSQCGQSSSGVQVSPDYDPAHHREFIGSAIRYRFMFEGEDVDELAVRAVVHDCVEAGIYYDAQGDPEKCEALAEKCAPWYRFEKNGGGA